MFTITLQNSTQQLYFSFQMKYCINNYVHEFYLYNLSICIARNNKFLFQLQWQQCVSYRRGSIKISYLWSEINHTYSKSKINHKRSKKRNVTRKKSEGNFNTSSIPKLTTFSSKAPTFVTLHLLSIAIPEMVDMGVTTKSSITIYVTTPLTQPPWLDKPSLATCGATNGTSVDIVSLQEGQMARGSSAMYLKQKKLFCNERIFQLIYIPMSKVLNILLFTWKLS